VLAHPRDDAWVGERGHGVLVLSRRSGESIVIGDSIVLTVVAVSGTRVKLGIAAPTSIPILRHEVADELRSIRSIAEDRVHNAL
jgi:carbon storage regulator